MSDFDPKNSKTQMHMNKFVGDHLHLFTKAIKKLKNEGMVTPETDLSMLHEAGFHGLWAAFHAYDKTAFGGTEFKRYAGPKIYGTMKCAITKDHPIPQYVRQQAKNLKNLSAAPVKQIVSEGSQVTPEKPEDSE